MYADAHAHVANVPRLMDQIDKIVDLLEKANVEFVVDNANNFREAKLTLGLAKRYPKLFYPTIGIHPEVLIPGSDIYIENFEIDTQVEKVRSYLLEHKDEYISIGECGLDYYWVDKKIQDLSEREKIKASQKKLLGEMIKLSCETGLPLVVHSRGAEEECFQFITDRISNKKRTKVLFHSYTGSLKVAKMILSNGYHLSFNGILTFPNASDIRRIFKYSYKKYPRQILAETDSPFLAPQIKRGEPCYPSYVRFVFDEMKRIVGVGNDNIEDTVYRNIKSFFNL